MKSNKLSVSIKKINYVIFKPKQKRVHTNSYNLNYSVPLKQVTEVKFLGVYISMKALRGNLILVILAIVSTFLNQWA